MQKMVVTTTAMMNESRYAENPGLLSKASTHAGCKLLQSENQ
jgi:hypothetical protein